MVSPLPPKRARLEGEMESVLSRAVVAKEFYRAPDQAGALAWRIRSPAFVGSYLDWEAPDASVSITAKAKKLTVFVQCMRAGSPTSEAERIPITYREEYLKPTADAAANQPAEAARGMFLIDTLLPRLKEAGMLHLGNKLAMWPVPGLPNNFRLVISPAACCYCQQPMEEDAAECEGCPRHAHVRCVPADWAARAALDSAGGVCQPVRFGCPTCEASLQKLCTLAATQQDRQEAPAGQAGGGNPQAAPSPAGAATMPGPATLPAASASMPSVPGVEHERVERRGVSGIPAALAHPASSNGAAHPATGPAAGAHTHGIQAHGAAACEPPDAPTTTMQCQDIAMPDVAPPLDAEPETVGSSKQGAGCTTPIQGFQQPMPQPMQAMEAATHFSGARPVPHAGGPFAPSSGSLPSQPLDMSAAGLASPHAAGDQGAANMVTPAAVKPPVSVGAWGSSTSPGSQGPSSLVANVTSRLRSLTAAANKAKEELQQRSQELRSAHASLAAADAERVELRAQVQQQLQQQADEAAAAASLRTQLDSALQEAQQARSQALAAQASAAEAEAQAEEMRLQVAQAKALAAELEAGRAQLLQQLEQEQTVRTAMAAELAECRAQFAELESAMGTIVVDED